MHGDNYDSFMTLLNKERKKSLYVGKDEEVISITYC